MGDPRNGDDAWGRFRDKCGAFVNSSAFQNTSKWIIVHQRPKVKWPACCCVEDSLLTQLPSRLRHHDHVPSVSFFIIVNAALLGVMTFEFVHNNEALRKQLEAFDLSILCVFTFDFLLQFIYLGRDIVYDVWLVFDGILVVTSWSFLNSSVKGFRSLRIFRIFALCGRLDSLKHILDAVHDSAPSMGAIWMILGKDMHLESTRANSHRRA
jgi:hypothetical protein